MRGALLSGLVAGGQHDENRRAQPAVAGSRMGATMEHLHSVAAEFIGRPLSQDTLDDARRAARVARAIGNGPEVQGCEWVALIISAHLYGAALPTRH